jgi:hypothetical protein
VRVLGMLAPRDCSVGTLRLLREAMADPVLRKVLLHAPVLSEPLLGLLWDLAEPGCRLRLGSAVLSAVANADVDDGWHLLGCLGYLQQVWPDLWPGRPMPRLVSTAQLLRLHHQAHEERVSPIRLRALAAGLGGFPAPPLPDGVVQGFRFVPLRSADDLIQEGERMGHCVGSIDYVIDCARGHGFGYRVQAEQAELRVAPGQRATVWINREDGLRWEIGELRARSNHSPLPPLRKAVERWIALQDEPRLMLRARIPDAAIGRTLRVVRHRRPAPFARCLQPPRPPEAQGWQLSLGFDVPF